MEAPTGTGKSYALLAQAIDWLAADATNKVVIATFTKQLQAQLADDIDKISAAGYPELAGVSDLVKGSVNRLSLRRWWWPCPTSRSRSAPPRGRTRRLQHRPPLPRAGLLPAASVHERGHAG